MVEWQNASLRAGGQEATVTAGSGPGRGIHVIQENSKENVIMCQLQATDRQRWTEHNLTTIPIKYSIQLWRWMKRNDCKNINHEKKPLRWRGSEGSTQPGVWQRCGGARPCIRSASEWAARSERGLRGSNAHHQAICHLINNKNKIFNTDFNKVKPCPIIKSPEQGLYNDFLNL